MLNKLIKDPYGLIQKIVNAQENLIVILQGDQPILMNKALNDFFGTPSFETYAKEFGPFVNNFVPHPFYFHAEKIAAGETWVEALLKLEEKDRIVSMVNTKHEPRAFSVQIDNSIDENVVVTLTDISQNLIKSIMIENNVSIDKKSGAYNKDYFVHTLESFQDAAAFNEKSIGITMVDISYKDDKEVENDSLADFVSHIKSAIRQNDMLVKWSDKLLLLSYLVESKENAFQFTQKMKHVIEGRGDLNVNLSVTLVQENEKIITAVKRASSVLSELSGTAVRMV